MRFVDVFDNANIYKIFQFSIMRRNTLKIIRDEVLKPDNVQNVLDFGCGIGYHSLEFPNSNYFGIEPIEGCIEKANAMHSGDRRTFLLGDHTALMEVPSSSYELIIAIGVLHHIDDEVASEFIKESYRILRPGGRLTTLDPVFHEEQSRLSKWIVGRDRGEWVRNVYDYQQIFNQNFSGVLSTRIFANLLRMPYDHVHLEVEKV